MSYVRTPLSLKSKRRIELLIYNPFQRMIPQSPQVFAVSCTWLHFSLYKQLLLLWRDATTNCSIDSYLQIRLRL